MSIIHTQIKWCLIINVLQVCPWRRPATVGSHGMVLRPELMRPATVGKRLRGYGLTRFRWFDAP